ncbi:unnamed protein product [Gemmata massiliana]|uniref:Uncharacterized protein n=2 Tax=Gemmata massiliana TaxID=1210884 RepID=A0A6P2D9L5_9BACT|nr:unnamed protein product [Gemmata massiliana]
MIDGEERNIFDGLIALKVGNLVRRNIVQTVDANARGVRHPLNLRGPLGFSKKNKGLLGYSLVLVRVLE